MSEWIYKITKHLTFCSLHTIHGIFLHFFLLGFDSVGKVVNKPDHGTLDWVKICEKSAKVITFIDLAGHERYLKTTVFGMTGHAPDFGMLMVSSH